MSSAPATRLYAAIAGARLAKQQWQHVKTLATDFPMALPSRHGGDNCNSERFELSKPKSFGNYAMLHKWGGRNFHDSHNAAFALWTTSSVPASPCAQSLWKSSLQEQGISGGGRDIWPSKPGMVANPRSFKTASRDTSLYSSSVDQLSELESC